MRISKVEMTRISLPIEAPLRHSYAVHTDFTRTVLQVYTDEGIVGLSETSVPPQVIEPFLNVLVGEDPMNAEKIRMRVSQRGYYSRQWLVASAFEIACWDIIGKAFGVPVYKLLGGKIRENVPVAAYLFYRYQNFDGVGEVTTPEQMVAHCLQLVAEHGFHTIKLKAGVPISARPSARGSSSPPTTGCSTSITNAWNGSWTTRPRPTPNCALRWRRWGKRSTMHADRNRRANGAWPQTDKIRIA